MIRLRFYQIFLSLSLITTLFTAHGFLHPVLAHNPTGGIKFWIKDEKIGPYVLLVATYPQPAIVGQTDVWVRVGEDGTGRLLRDTVVTIEAKSRNGGPTQTAQATHNLAGNAFDYVAHLDLKDPGQWDFTVYVEDKPGQVHVSFTETVTRGPSTLLIGLVVVFVVLAVSIGVYLRRQSAAMTLEEPAD